MIRYWNVFTTEMAKEKAAEMILRKRGFTVCVPSQERIVRGRTSRASRGSAGPRRIISCPILPRHVFVAFPGQIWGFHDVLALKVITGFIANADKSPGCIPDTQMREFLNACAEDVKPTPQFQLTKGQRVTVKRGAFAELKATVLHANTLKAKILVDLLGRPCETLIEVSKLEVLEPAKKKPALNGKQLQTGANQIRQKSGRRVADRAIQ